MKPLNAKQKLFVAHYVKHLNYTEAAIAAGYSAKTAHSAGPRLGEQPAVKAAITAALSKQVAKLELQADEILGELKAIGFRVPDGELLKYSDKIRALELLGKHLKLWTEKHEHKFEDPDAQKLTLEQLKKLAK